MELKHSIGENIELKCNKCDQSDTYAINEIKAQSRFLPLLATVGLVGSIGILLWISSKFIIGQAGSSNYIFVFLVLAIPVLVFRTILKSERVKINIFNKS